MIFNCRAKRYPKGIKKRFPTMKRGISAISNGEYRIYMRKLFIFLRNNLFLFLIKIGIKGTTKIFIGGVARIIDPYV